MGKTLNTEIVAQVLHQSQLHGRVVKTKTLMLNLTARFCQKACGRLKSTGTRFCDVMGSKLSLLAIRLDTMFCAHRTLHVITNTPSSPWWWWQHHAVHTALCSRQWMACEVRGQNECILQLYINTVNSII